MSVEQELPTTSAVDRQKQLKQLEHDIKTYLGIVSMGMLALEGVREEAAVFVELCKTIEEDGVQPLKETVAKIVAVALAKTD